MDGFLFHNLLSHFLGKNFKLKAEMLADLRVPGLNLVRDLVIDPRNDIEHEYTLTTEKQARNAVELAELFLAGTEDEDMLIASISHGWCVEFTHEAGPGYRRIEYRMTRNDPPMLILDVF